VSYDDSIKNADDKAAAQDFLQQFIAWGKEVNGGGNELSPFAQSMWVYGSGAQSELEDYIRSGSYGEPFDAETPRVAGMIVFNKLDQEKEQYAYTIRLNMTERGEVPLRK
jgi:hypothetical protein